MKVVFLILATICVAVKSKPLEKWEIPTDTPPCSMNASTAYTDIILIIDTSSNMGNANLKKISTSVTLALSKFTIGQNVDITAGYRNTRIAVVTYDDQAVIAANFTDINSISDLTRVLNGLTAKSTSEANLYDGMVKAFYLKTNCTDPDDCGIATLYRRPTAHVIFAASANTDSIYRVPGLVSETDQFDDGTFITVNFSPQNAPLTNLIMQMTWNPNVNGQMYNLTGSSNTLSNDINWAVLQATCHCGDFGESIVYWDSKNSRYTRYAECMAIYVWSGNYPNDVMDMCQWDQNQYQVPAYVLTKARTQYIANVQWEEIGVEAVDPSPIKAQYPFYIGLHKNSQGVWSWYDYNRTEFPLSYTGYSDWGNNQPNGTDGCVIFDSDDGQNLVWKTISCQTETTSVASVMCQFRACDASDTYCCYNCHSQGQPKPKKLFKKTYGKKKNGKWNKLVRIAKDE